MQSIKQYFKNIGIGAVEVGRQAAANGPGRVGGIFKLAGRYLVNILVSVDQFGNTITGGSPDETISSRLGRNYRGSLLERGVDCLFFWQGKNHCEKAIEPEDRAKDSIFK